MRRRTILAFATFATALASGVASVAGNDWFGSGDLIPLAIYSVPFALLAAPITRFGHNFFRRLPIWLSVLLAIICGFVYGVLATFLAAVTLGPWMGAMSVDLLPVWCFSAALVFSGSLIVERCQSKPLIAVGLGVVFAISIGTDFGLQAGLIRLLNRQQLTIHRYRYTPHSDIGGGLTFDEENVPSSLLGESPLNESDVASLNNAGLTGTLTYEQLMSSGRSDWPHAKVVCVMSGPVTKPISLPLPRHCTVIYIQTPEGFRQIPENFPTMPGSLQIRPDEPGSLTALIIRHD